MCSNYRPVTRADRLLAFFGVERGVDDIPVDVFPTGLAPFIRRVDTGTSPDGRVLSEGAFGLLPFFAKEVAYGRRTYNARSETVAELPSYKHAWRRGHRCVIPAEFIYEPNYETGKAVRWRIGKHGDVPMGVAGIYTLWRHPEDGREMFSFSMLTVNADDHPLMKRFHKPGEEKRMVVILRPEEYDDWLACPVADASRFFEQWQGELVAAPDPLMRAPRTQNGKTIVPPQVDLPGSMRDLF